MEDLDLDLDNYDLDDLLTKVISVLDYSITVFFVIEIIIRFVGEQNKKDFFSLSKKNNLILAASNLYKIFRIIRKKGYKKIQINKIPNYGAGIAINDRINRASKF